MAAPSETISGNLPSPADDHAGRKPGKDEMNHTDIKTAANRAAECGEWLQAALSKSTRTESIYLLTLIDLAATLRRDLNHLAECIEADNKSALAIDAEAVKLCKDVRREISERIGQ
jgi:hypothetical protein